MSDPVINAEKWEHLFRENLNSHLVKQSYYVRPKALYIGITEAMMFDNFLSRQNLRWTERCRRTELEEYAGVQIIRTTLGRHWRFVND